MRRVETPVLIVGAGPAGLTAAILLARQGIASLVVDRRDGPHRAPQAHVVNPRSLEIFRSMDVDMAALHAAATPRADGGQVVWATALAGAELGRMPYERQDDAVLALTPEPLLNLPQHKLEPTLVERFPKRRCLIAAYGMAGHRDPSIGTDDERASDPQARGGITERGLHGRLVAACHGRAKAEVARQ